MSKRGTAGRSGPGRLAEQLSLTPGAIDALEYGVDMDEKLAEKFRYKRAYLLANRLEDRTLWSW